jgi:hypothetical protein
LGFFGYNWQLIHKQNHYYFHGEDEDEDEDEGENMRLYNKRE